MSRLILEIVIILVLIFVNGFFSASEIALVSLRKVVFYASVEEAAGKMIQIKDRFEPARQNRAIYDETFATYVKLYDALCPLFEARQG